MIDVGGDRKISLLEYAGRMPWRLHTCGRTFMTAPSVSMLASTTLCGVADTMQEPRQTKISGKRGMSVSHKTTRCERARVKAIEVFTEKEASFMSATLARQLQGDLTTTRH